MKIILATLVVMAVASYMHALGNIPTELFLGISVVSLVVVFITGLVAMSKKR